MRFLFAIYSIYFFNVFIYYHQICQANLCATCALRVCYTSKLTTFLENFRNFRYKKNPGKSRLSEVLIVFCIRLKLSFGELKLSLGQPKNLVFMRFLLSLKCEMLQTCYKPTTSHYSSPHLRTITP